MRKPNYSLERRDRERQKAAKAAAKAEARRLEREPPAPDAEPVEES